MNKAVNVVERIWRDTADKQCAQLVFCDLSTPATGKGFSVYKDMRDKFVACSDFLGCVSARKT